VDGRGNDHAGERQSVSVRSSCMQAVGGMCAGCSDGMRMDMRMWVFVIAWVHGS